MVLCPSVKEDGSQCGHQLGDIQETTPCPVCGAVVKPIDESEAVVFIICQGKNDANEPCNQVIKAGIDACSVCNTKVPTIITVSQNSSLEHNEVIHVSVEEAEDHKSSVGKDGINLDDESYHTDEEDADYDEASDSEYQPYSGLEVDSSYIRRSRRPTKKSKRAISLPGEEVNNRSKKRREIGSTGDEKKTVVKSYRKPLGLDAGQLIINCKYCKENVFLDAIFKHLQENHQSVEGYDETMKETKTLYYDLKRTEGGANYKDKTVACKLCDKMYKNNITLLQHVKTLHEDDHSFDASYLDEIRANTQMTCVLCGSSVREDSMTQHLVSLHTEPGQYHCEDCGNTFRRESLLLEHRQRVHTKQARHLCHLCPKDFKTKIYLKEHIDAVHVRKKSFPCTICDKVLTSPRILTKHISSIHGNSKHACPECGRVFNTPANMRRHVKLVHHPDLVDRVVCEYTGCVKTFTTTANMRQHVYACHASEYNFKCEKCQTGFNRARLYQEHMEIHKFEAKVGQPAQPNSILLTTQPTQREPMYLQIERMPAGMKLASQSKTSQVLNHGSAQIFEQVGTKPVFQQDMNQSSEMLTSECETVLIKATNAQGQPVKLSFMPGEAKQLDKNDITCFVGPNDTVQFENTEVHGVLEGDDEIQYITMDGNSQLSMEQPSVHVIQQISNSEGEPRYQHLDGGFVQHEVGQTYANIDPQEQQVIQISQETLAAVVANALNGQNQESTSTPDSVIRQQLQAAIGSNLFFPGSVQGVPTGSLTAVVDGNTISVDVENAT